MASIPPIGGPRGAGGGALSRVEWAHRRADPYLAMTEAELTGTLAKLSKEERVSLLQDVRLLATTAGESAVTIAAAQRVERAIAVLDGTR